MTHKPTKVGARLARRAWICSRASVVIVLPGGIAGTSSDQRSVIPPPEAWHAQLPTQNDIRGTGIVNSDRIVIPRGTPVYHAAFGSSRIASHRVVYERE